MDDLTLKFNQLDSFSKQLTLDFIELLLKMKVENGAVSYVDDRQEEYKRLPKMATLTPSAGIEPAQVPFDETFRKRLLEWLPWTDQEIAEFDEAIAKWTDEDDNFSEENKAYLRSLDRRLHPLVLAHFKKLRATQTAEEAKEDPFGNKAYKKKLVSIPAWTEEDVQALEDHIHNLKNWEIPTW